MLCLSYSLERDFTDRIVDVPRFKDAVAAAGITLQEVQMSGDSVTLVLDELSQEQEVKLNDIVHAHRAFQKKMAEFKAEKFAAIDAKTDEIITRGFSFMGLRFSTSLEAQARMLGMDALRNDVYLQYPIVFNSLDDEASVTLANAEMVHGFVLTGIGYYRAAIDSGSALKSLVRSAQTPIELSCISDPRQ